MLVLGDSLSAAHNMPPEDGWVALLDAQLDEMNCPADIVNASISGETTIGGVTRLPRLIELNNPSIVIVELGVNDGLRGFPVQQMRDNLENTINLASDAGAKVLLLGIQIPSNYGRRYSDSFRNTYSELSDEHAVALIPFFLDGVHDNEALMQADTVHPNEAAQPLLKEVVLKKLLPLLDCDNS